MDLNLWRFELTRDNFSNRKLHELADNRTCIVVCHDMFWTNHHIVAGSDDFPFWQTDAILLDDLLDDCLWCSRPVAGDSGKEPALVAATTQPRHEVHNPRG